MSILFYSIILSLATVAWAYLFVKRDYHPQPLRNLIQIFIYGTFAMVPVLAYKRIYENYFPNLAEYKIFEPLINAPILLGLFTFIANLLFLVVVLIALSSIVAFILTFYQKQVLVNLRRAIKEEPLGFMAVSLMIGLLIFSESFLEAVFNVPIVHTLLGAILFLSIIEEFVKHLVVRLTDDQKIKDIDDAITLSIVVGLAFAFVESIAFAYVARDASLLAGRAAFAMPIHLISSAIFGYYYGVAHFSKKIMQNAPAQMERPMQKLAKFLHLRKSTVFADEELTKGIFFATAFHGLANVLYTLNLAYVMVPLIILGLLMVSNLYTISQLQLWMIGLKRPRRGLKKVK